MRRFTPLFGAKVEHIVEKHSDVGSSHCGGACGHIFGFRGGHSDWCWHGRIGFDEGTIVEDHVSDGRAASVWAILPAGVRKYGQVGVWYAVLAAYIVDRIGSSVWVELDGIVWASMSQIRAQESVWPGQIQAFASLQTAKRISARVL